MDAVQFLTLLVINLPHFQSPRCWQHLAVPLIINCNFSQWVQWNFWDYWSLIYPIFRVKDDGNFKESHWFSMFFYTIFFHIGIYSKTECRVGFCDLIGFILLNDLKKGRRTCLVHKNLWAINQICSLNLLIWAKLKW